MPIGQRQQPGIIDLAATKPNPRGWRPLPPKRLADNRLELSIGNWYRVMLIGQAQLFLPSDTVQSTPIAPLRRLNE